jgi:hypothetical protein
MSRSLGAKSDEELAAAVMGGFPPGAPGRQIADAVGISYGTVYRWKRGQTAMERRTRGRVLAWLGSIEPATDARDAYRRGLEKARELIDLELASLAETKEPAEDSPPAPDVKPSIAPREASEIAARTLQDHPPAERSSPRPGGASKGLRSGGSGRR